jgi:thiamine pyrophosphokinase
VPAAIVFAAVSLAPTARLRSRLASLQSPYVICADAGAATALAFGLTPHEVIGDFDSLDAEMLRQLRAQHVPISTYPRDKDATDGQLAIERALQLAPEELYLLGYLGGPRLDQLLANIMLLTHVDIPAVLLDERNECRLLRAHADYTWQPEPSEVISLIPLTEDVVGVFTKGLRWPLTGDTLRRGDTRGVSNEPNAERAQVGIASGLLLVTRHFV